MTSMIRPAGRTAFVALSVALASLTACDADGTPKERSSAHPVSEVSATPTASPSASVVVSATPGTSGTSANIVDLADGGKVRYRQPVSGTVVGMAAGEDLWVVVQPYSNSLFYPQPGPILVMPDGTWSTQSFFGVSQAQGAGEEFALYVVTTTKDARTKFDSYLSNAAKNGYQGFATLPTGVRPLKRIHVIRI